MSVNKDFSEDQIDVIEGIEEDFEYEEIFEPFNPADVDIITKAEVIDSLLKRVERSYKKDASGSVNLAPDFQRKAGIWKIETKSQLIESILLGIPLPMFYVSATRTGEWDVVDGIQRLSVLRDFMLGEQYIKSVEAENPRVEFLGRGFKLKGLEFLRQFEGKTFSELPNKQQDDIRDCNVQVTVIRSGTPTNVKFNIFKRINTGGTPLTNQEVRHALYQGAATKFLKKLAESNLFKHATAGSITDLRMEGRELILRVIASLLFGHEYSGSKIDIEHILNEAMRALNKIGGTPENTRESVLDYNVYSLEELEHIFYNGMRRASNLFETYAFRKTVPGEKRTPINKALFETWSVCLGLLNTADWEKLKDRKKAFLASYAVLLKNEDFVASVGNRGYLTSYIKLRYNMINTLIRDPFLDI